MATSSDETSLIQRFLRPLAAPGADGFQDDAASLTPNDGHELVLTSDAIVEGTHFLPTDSAEDIAVKAISVNLSDLTAKGATPQGYLVSLIFPHPPQDEWMEAFAKGLARNAHGKLLGGDMSVGGNVLSISVTAIGEIPSGQIVRRKGAKPGDAIFLTGKIGTKAAGLKAALDDGWALNTISPEERKFIIKQYAAPTVPFADIYARLIRQYASASLDISDGLALDLQRLCNASQVGARINLAHIPMENSITKLIEHGDFSIQEAITGGDDYVALFIVPARKAHEVARSGGIAKCYQIGEIIPQSDNIEFLDKNSIPLAISNAFGYDHFST